MNKLKLREARKAVEVLYNLINYLDDTESTEKNASGANTRTANKHRGIDSAKVRSEALAVIDGAYREYCREETAVACDEADSGFKADLEVADESLRSGAISDGDYAAIVMDAARNGARQMEVAYRRTRTISDSHLRSYRIATHKSKNVRD